MEATPGFMKRAGRWDGGPEYRPLLLAALSGLLGVLGVGCDREPARRTGLFEDVTARSGIDFVMTSGRLPSTQILEVKGGGLGLIDHDGDGDLDIFVPNGATLEDPERGPGCRLFENLGGLRFRDVTAAAGLTLRRWSFGVAVGDYDGDGRDDIYVACFGPDVLLRNRGGGRFEDVTGEAGLGSPAWGSSCAFGDIDRDGDLDLYVTNFVDFDPRNPPPRATYMGVEVLAGPLGLAPRDDILYENRGDGTFRDISESSGCRDVPPSNGLNSVIFDHDGDGWQDIFVANDSMANFLFHNLGSGRFEDVGLASGVAFNKDGAAQATMGIAIGDVDGNGYPDLFTTNFSSDTNTLHLNLDGKFFSDATSRYGLGMVSYPYVGWACGFFDFDHDGDEDLLIVNGHVFPEASKMAMDSTFPQSPQLFERRAQRFEPVGEEVAGAWLGRAYRARAAAFGDLDRDGDIDAVFGEVNGPLRVLRNAAGDGSAGQWLIVELRDTRAGSRNHRALGSRIELQADGRRQVRWLHGGGPFESASAQYAHFATAKKPARTHLRITWPDGTEQRVDDVTWNRYLTVRR